MQRYLHLFQEADFVTALTKGCSAALEALSSERWEARLTADAADFDASSTVGVQLQGELSGCLILGIAEAGSGLLGKLSGEADSSKSILESWAKSALAASTMSSGQEWKLLAGVECNVEGGGRCLLILDVKDGRSLTVQLSFDTALIAALEGQDRRNLALPESPNLDLVLDVELNVVLRFGQRQLSLRELLELTSGSVIELDRQVDEPVELLLEGKVIARGEAVVVDGNYGLRVTEVPQPISPAMLS